MKNVVVIGGGPGGYVAAIRAAQLGQNVRLIERENLGGTCLNVGCIPTKALLDSAHVFEQIKTADTFGVSVNGDVTFSWSAMQERKSQITERLRGGIANLLKVNKIEHLSGAAHFVSDTQIEVNGQLLSFDQAIIACGTLPAIPAFIPKSDRVITSTQALSLTQLPEKMMILGGGVIGCEFATLFATLGVEVTIVEMLPSLLPMLDKEIGRTLTTKFKKMGIRILTGKAMDKIEVKSDVVTVEVAGESIVADMLLVAIGRTPNTVDLGLGKTSIVCTDRGYISVNAQCQTNLPNIYAIGDIATSWQLAHVASTMGVVAAEHFAGHDVAFLTHAIPGCVFTTPEIATVGLTVEQAIEKGIQAVAGKFPFAAIGKAMTLGQTEGFCKIVTDSATDKIIGVHMIGPHAADLIAAATVCVERGLTACELGNVIHAHPTLGEIILEAAHSVHGRAIHAAPPRR